MEHECKGCGKLWLDHTLWKQCPYCGSENILHLDADNERDDELTEQSSEHE